MDVTIITMTYLKDKKRLRWFKKTIDSVLMQKGINFEYIIIDDGSPLNIPKNWISNSRIRYFRRKHKGRANSSNFATEQGIGKYRCFVADDDLLFGNDSLAIRYYLAEKHPTSSLIWTNGYKIDAIGNILREFRNPDAISGKELIKKGGIINGTTAFIKRKLWLKFKLDEQYTTYEEYDFQIRLAKWSEDHGYDFKYFPDYYTAVNRIHNMQSSKNRSKEQKSMLHRIKQNGMELYHNSPNK